MLRALRAELPSEHFVYIADSGHAPYGERDDTHVLARAHAITDHLVLRHGIKALVVACNTATATAIGALRQRYANLPIIGIEPPIKPAAAASNTHAIGVMATRGTLTSEKFRSLLTALHGQATFVLQPCDGLANAIECDDAIKVESACARYTRAMGTFGPNPGDMDMLVMGCTHYPFADAVLRAHVGHGIGFWEGGVPVARQTRKLLTDGGQLRPEPGKNQTTADTPLFFTTGSAHTLAAALQRWLHLDAPVHVRAIE